jgi:FMN reductase
VAAADGLIIATPGYHGGMSGLVKNGMDHLESLRDDARPYLSGRAVGTIVTAAGWQACGTTLVSLRSTIHALRGWPTPYGVTVNSADQVFAEGGVLLEPIAAALRLVTDQVLEFASRA